MSPASGTEVGNYDGPASIDGHRVEAQLDAINDRGSVRWRGAVFFVDTDIDLAALAHPIEIDIAGHRAEAKVIHASAELGYLYLHGTEGPPFDSDTDLSPSRCRDVADAKRPLSEEARRPR